MQYTTCNSSLLSHHYEAINGEESTKSQQGSSFKATWGSSAHALCVLLKF